MWCRRSVGDDKTHGNACAIYHAACTVEYLNCDCHRWVYFFDPVKNFGLRVMPVRETGDAQTSWGWSASRFSLETLESTSHNHELEADPNGQIHVHLDRRMMGLGGYDSWSPNVKNQYIIATNTTVQGALLFSPILSMVR